MSEKIIIEKEDFDLTKKFELFTVLYSVKKDTNHVSSNEVEEWVVIGHVLKNSSDRRNFEYVLASHPISVYIKQVKKIELGELQRDSFVSTDKKEVITQKRDLVIGAFNQRLKGLDLDETLTTC